MLSGKVLFCVILVAGVGTVIPLCPGLTHRKCRIQICGNQATSPSPYGTAQYSWQEAQSASLPFLRLPLDDNDNEILVDVADARLPVEMRARVREGVPPPLCAGRCASPPRGPVCAFDAAGTARTFATLCELEAVSCRESTYYAITGLGEC